MTSTKLSQVGLLKVYRKIVNSFFLHVKKTNTNIERCSNKFHDNVLEIKRMQTK